MHKLVLLTVAVASILATATIANAIDFGPTKGWCCPILGNGIAVCL